VTQPGPCGWRKVASTALEAEGIGAFLLDDKLIAINPLLSNAVGGVKVAVPAEQAERAREILAEEEQPPPPGEAAIAPPARRPNQAWILVLLCIGGAVVAVAVWWCREEETP